MPRVTHVKKARKDIKRGDEIVVKKGESYYWWKFAYGSKNVSKTPPKASQLTQSDFLSQMYEIEEAIEDVGSQSFEDLQSFVEDIKGRLDCLQEETEDKLSNMPDQLQEAPTGEMMQGRIDAAQEMIDDLDNIEFEINEDEIAEEAKDLEGEREKDETQEEYDERIEEAIKEAIEEKKQEIVDEIGNISYQGE